jgi:hypothetical protein
MAKRIIHLVCRVGEVINADPETRDLLQLFFLPDYNVSVAELIIPGGFAGRRGRTFFLLRAPPSGGPAPPVSPP